MKKKLSLVFAFLLLITLLFSSCEKASDSAAVMKIGDMEVRADLYNYIYENFKDDEADKTEEEIKTLTEDALVTVFASLSLAEDYGLSIDDTYFTDLANYTYESSKAEEGFSENLEDSHMTEWVFRFLTKQSALKEMIYAAMQDAGDIPTGDSLLEKVMGEDFIAVKQLLIVGERREEGSFVPAESHTDKEARALAEEALERARSGENFDDLVAEYGESLYMMQQPEGYYVCRGMWDNENESAAFSLEIGEISDVVESDAGFSLFMRCEKEESVAEGLLSDIEENYGDSVYTLKTEEKIDTLKKQVEYTENYDRYIKKDEKTK